MQGLGRQEKEERPHPGDRPNRNLEAGLPVYAVPFRILIDPAFNLSEGFARIQLVAREEKCFRQFWQMLMPVKLVNDLRVCRVAMNEVVIGPEFPRPLIAGYWIAMPVQILAERDIFVSED